MDALLAENNFTNEFSKEEDSEYVESENDIDGCKTFHNLSQILEDHKVTNFIHF